MFGWINRLFGKKPATGGEFKLRSPQRLFGEGGSPLVLPPSYPGFRTREQNEAVRRAAPPAPVRSHHFYDPGRPVDSSDDLIRMAIMVNLASDHSAHRGCDEHVKPEPVVIDGGARSAAYWVAASHPSDCSPSDSSSDSSCSSSSSD